MLNIANLNSIQEPVSHYLETNLNYAYHPESYFYSKEKQPQDDKPISTSIAISDSDSDSDSDSGEEIAVICRKSRRESRRATGRVSLIITPEPARSTQSLLHQQPAKQTVKPTVVAPPMILREKAPPPPPPMGDLLAEIRASKKAVPPPPPPASRLPQLPSQSKPQTPSQPPSQSKPQLQTPSQTPMRPALHADLLAEIRASGVDMSPILHP